MKYLLTLVTFFSLNTALAKGTGTGTGTIPIQLQASIHLRNFDFENRKNINTRPFQYQKALVEASEVLSAGNNVLATEIYNAYNPIFADHIVRENPQLDMYQSYERDLAVAKFAMGVSYFDKTQMMNGMDAVKALSSQRGLLEDLSEMDLIDIWEASQGVKEWSL